MIWEKIMSWFVCEPQPVTKQPPKKATHKICGACKEEKPLDDYYIKENGQRSSSMCKECYKEHQKQQNRKKKEKTNVRTL